MSGDLHFDDFGHELTTMWTSMKEGRQFSAFTLENKKISSQDPLFNEPGVTPGPSLQG